MSKYDYEGIGYRRSYEDYVRIMKTGDGLPIPTKEEYEAEIDASIEQGIKVLKAREMLTALQSTLMEDIDLLMEVYDAVAPIMNFMGTEKATEEFLMGWKKIHLKNLIERRRYTKKDIDAEFGEGAWKTNEEVAKLTEKINKLRTELKGENTHA